MLISERYIKLPVSKTACEKFLCFFKDGKLVYDIAVRLDTVNPDTYFYYDLSDFAGQDLVIAAYPYMDYTSANLLNMPEPTFEKYYLRDFCGMSTDFTMPVAADYSFEFVNKIPSVQNMQSDKFRPQLRFTAQRGWINDPNGLVFYEGRYHLFFQHNMAGSTWGNMSWGHAVSEDLLHWTMLDEALLPDETGVMWSGSAVVDSKNLTGLKENQHDVLLLYYTAAASYNIISSGKKFCQCLAYSTDGGYTFKKYNKNPVIDFEAVESRDPWVVYSDKDKCYYCALFLHDAVFGIYRTYNLLDFEKTQEISLSGDAECPALYPIKDQNGNEYWVLSGAHGVYSVGKMENGQFIKEQSEQPMTYGVGNAAYAAQTFNGLDGRRVRMAWDTSGIQSGLIGGAMTIPTEISLKNKDGKLQLCNYPVNEFSTLRYNEKDCHLNLLQNELKCIGLSGKFNDIKLVSKQKSGVMAISLLGLNFIVDFDKSVITYSKFEMPVVLKDGSFEIRIITDTASTEIFLANGEASALVCHIADESISQLRIKTSVKAEVNVNIAKLKSIWE